MTRTWKRCQGKDSVNGNEESVSSTGEVGTAMYVAPELEGRACKSTYDEKVDLYSLGVIFFEMCHCRFATETERYKVLIDLRSPGVTLPSDVLNDPNPNRDQQNKIIKWLLHHDRKQRPSAKELLASDLLPPPPYEDQNIDGTLRHFFADTQGKNYRDLVGRHFAQQVDASTENECHSKFVTTDAKGQLIEVRIHSISFSNYAAFSFDHLIQKMIVALFRQYGGIEMKTALLSPDPRTPRKDAFRLMTTSGQVMELRYDMHLPFMRHVASEGIRHMRRYAVDHVYRSVGPSHSHPQQLYECAFDIIAPSLGRCDQLVDAEPFFIAYGLARIIPVFKGCVLSFRVNHTLMLRAIMMRYNVPVEMYSGVFETVRDFIDYRIPKFELHSRARSLLKKSDKMTAALIDALLTEIQMKPDSSDHLEIPFISDLIHGDRVVSGLVRSAVKEIGNLVSCVRRCGVKVYRRNAFSAVTSSNSFLCSSSVPSPSMPVYQSIPIAQGEKTKVSFGKYSVISHQIEKSSRTYLALADDTIMRCRKSSKFSEMITIMIV